MKNPKYKNFVNNIVLLILSFFVFSSCDNNDKLKSEILKTKLCSNFWIPTHSDVHFIILKFTKDGKSYDLSSPSIVNEYQLRDSTISVKTSEKDIQIRIIDLTDSTLSLKLEGEEKIIEFKPAKSSELIIGKWKVISTTGNYIIEFLYNGNGNIEMISDTNRIIENIQYYIKFDTLLLTDKNKNLKILKFNLKDEFNLELIDSENIKLNLKRI